MKNIHQRNKTDSMNIISEILMLHKKGILTDEEFAALMRIIGANFVETELSNKINKTLRSKINPYFSLGASYV